MRPTSALNPGRLGAAAQCRYFPSSSGSQIVHKRSSPCASTNRAMIVSTSGRGDPEKINLRMLSTDSLEKRLGSFGTASALDTTCVEDWVALSMNRPFLEPLSKRMKAPPLGGAVRWAFKDSRQDCLRVRF